MLASLAAERVAALNREGLQASLERLALAQARVRFGQSPQLDVDRAEQDVERARSDVITGDERLYEDREAFGNLMGISTPMAVAEDLDLAALERAIVQTCRMNADIESDPLVAASRGRLELAERAIEDAELRVAPSLSFASQGGYQSEVTLGPRGQWSIQGLLNVPFYDGGARYGAAHENRALASQARQELSATRLQALTRVTRSKRVVNVSEAARNVAKRQRDLAQRIDHRIRDGYARGIGTSLDLVTSAESLRQAETNLALLEFEVGKARAGAILANAECIY
jgi:outer membrane protein TolC